MWFWDLMIGPLFAALAMVVLTVWAPRGERLATFVWCVGVYVAAGAMFVYAIAQGWL